MVRLDSRSRFFRKKKNFFAAGANESKGRIIPLRPEFSCRWWRWRKKPCRLTRWLRHRDHKSTLELRSNNSYVLCVVGRMFMCYRGTHIWPEKPIFYWSYRHCSTGPLPSCSVLVGLHWRDIVVFISSECSTGRVNYSPDESFSRCFRGTWTSRDNRSLHCTLGLGSPCYILPPDLVACQAHWVYFRFKVPYDVSLIMGARACIRLVTLSWTTKL